MGYAKTKLAAHLLKTVSVEWNTMTWNEFLGDLRVFFLPDKRRQRNDCGYKGNMTRYFNDFEAVLKGTRKDKITWITFFMMGFNAC